MFAWDATDRGTNVHLQAEPTKLELLHKEFGSKKDNFKKSQKESILEKVCLHILVSHPHFTPTYTHTPYTHPHFTPHTHIPTLLPHTSPLYPHIHTSPLYPHIQTSPLYSHIHTNTHPHFTPTYTHPHFTPTYIHTSPLYYHINHTCQKESYSNRNCPCSDPRKGEKTSMISAMCSHFCKNLPVVMYRTFRNVPIFTHIPPLCPLFHRFQGWPLYMYTYIPTLLPHTYIHISPLYPHIHTSPLYSHIHTNTHPHCYPHIHTSPLYSHIHTYISTLPSQKESILEKVCLHSHVSYPYFTPT